MKLPRTNKGFTLIELLVVIGIIALLASIAVPAFNGVTIRAQQTKAMSNAKQIGLACKQFAIDNNGQYPSYTVTSGSVSTTAVTDSNSAFCQLFPAYLQTISPFYLSKSQFTPGNQQSDPDISKAATWTPPTPLPAGTNEWAYVTGLYDTSNTTFPLLADGFADASSHTYSPNETTKGGIWKGNQAIVVFCDDSAKVIKLNTQYKVPGSPDNSDLFSTSESSQGWLAAPTNGSSGNTVVNPL